jgi:hypothetical protein
MKSKKILSNIFVYVMIFVAMILLSAINVNAVQSAVNLGTAGNFVILAKSGISTTGTTSIVGDIGVSPIDSTAITGFGLIADASNQFATSSLVTGKVYAADYTPPTPINMGVAVGDMQTAYTDAAGRTETSIVTELGAGDISGMTLAPGLYKWGTGVLINNGVTLSGGANDIWIFQIAQDLTVGNGAVITLSGGAQAKNIFWQVAGQTTLGTTSQFKGIILCQTMVEMQTGATLNGRALAQTAVTLDANAVTAPTGSTIIPTPNPTPDSGTGSGSSGSSESGSSGGASDSGGSSGVDTSQCTEWSACSSEGMRTKTCTQTGSTDKSVQRQACTPTQANETEPTTPAITPGPDTGSGSPEAGQENDGVTPTSGNQATDQATGQSGHQNSWWDSFLAWLSGLFKGK